MHTPFFLMLYSYMRNKSTKRSHNAMTYPTTSRQGKRSAGHRRCQDSGRRHHDVGCHERRCSEVCHPPPHPDRVGPAALHRSVDDSLFFLVFSSRELLEKELESVGIRLNRLKPNIYFKVQFSLIFFNLPFYAM